MKISTLLTKSLLLMLTLVLSVYISDSYAQDAGLKKHKVKAGDTLYGIARTYGLTISEIRALNKIRGNTIQIGQIIIVGSETAKEIIKSEEVVVPVGAFKTHVMRKREPIDSVLSTYKMTKKELLLLNPGITIEALVTGSTLNVLVPPDTLYPDPYAIRVDTTQKPTINADIYKESDRAIVLFSGELYNPEALSMAHFSIPIGNLVRLRNPLNDARIAVRVNDRSDNPQSIKISKAAAQALQINTSSDLEILSSSEL